MKTLVILPLVLSVVFAMDNNPDDSSIFVSDDESVSSSASSGSSSSSTIMDDGNKLSPTEGHPSSNTAQNNRPSVIQFNPGSTSTIIDDANRQSSSQSTSTIGDVLSLTPIADPTVRATDGNKLSPTQSGPSSNPIHNDRKTVIRYPTDSPTVSPKDPASRILDIYLGGMEYIDRIYLPSQLDIKPHGLDTPTSIVTSMIHEQKNSITAIVGEPGSGKTVALYKIQDLIEKTPTSLSVTHIDGNDLMMPVDKPPANWMDLAAQKLFGNVVHRKPSEVIILIDNVDKLPSYMIEKTGEFLQVLHDKGSRIVVTTGSNIEMIDTIVRPENKMRIPQLNAPEMEQFLSGFWDTKLNRGNHRAHTEYAKAVAVVVDKLPVFKSFASMKLLHECLTRNSQNVLVKSDEYLSLNQYIELGTSDPNGLIKMLKRTVFNKMKVVERLIAPMVTATSTDYDSAAIKNVLAAEPSGSLLPKTLSVMPKKDSVGKISDVLLHEDVANYIAARNFIKNLGSEREHYNLAIEELMVKSEYTNVVEYFNAALLDSENLEKFEPVFKDIVNKGDDSWHKVMDNAISQGYDEIASNLIKAVDSTEKISEYFENTLGKSDRTLLKSNTEYELGMLTKAGTTVEANRQEMMFRKGMEKTILKLSEFEQPKVRGMEYKMWRPSEFINYLDDFLLRYPNNEVYKIIRSYETSARGTDQLPPREANARLYKIVKYGNIRNDVIMYDLTKAGGKPHRVRGVNGETLLHLAVAKRDPHLLNYMMNGLKIQAKDLGPLKTLLHTALDTNPLPFYSQPNFWEMMHTMLEKGLIEVPYTRFKTDLILPHGDDLSLPIHKLINGADTTTMNKVRSELMVSNEPLEQLSPTIKSLRRRIVLSEFHESSFRNFKKVAILALATKYRGLDPYLSPREQLFYEKTILRTLDSIVGNRVSETKEAYVGRCLRWTVGTTKDFEFVKKIYNAMKTMYGNNERSMVWNHQLEMLRQPWSRRAPKRFKSDTTSLEEIITSKRIKWFSEHPLQESVFDESFVPPLETTNEIVLPSAEEPGVAGPSGCGRFGRRRRRSAANCLISDDEYDKIIKFNEENGKKIPVIDTEEFVKNMDTWLHEDKNKYEELIEVGKTLIEKQGAALEGDYVNLVKDRIQSQKENTYDSSDYNTNADLEFNDHAEIHHELVDQHEFGIFNNFHETPGQMQIIKDSPLSTGIHLEKTYTNVEESIIKNQPKEVFVRPYEFEMSPIIEPKIISPAPEIIHKPVIYKPPLEYWKPSTIPRASKISRLPFRFKG